MAATGTSSSEPCDDEDATVSRSSKTQLFRFPAAVARDPAIDTWMAAHAGPLGTIAQHWFDTMRACGDDVRELLHDGHPTACVGEAAFGYVNAFTAHVNVGFFRGADLPDPHGLLEGAGKAMRHVKLRTEGSVDADALAALIVHAARDMRARLAAEDAGAALPQPAATARRRARGAPCG